MVANTGAEARTGGIRPLDAPLPVQVNLGDNDIPAAIGVLRNRNARGSAHRPSTGSGRTEASSLTPLMVSVSKDGRRTFSYGWHQVLEVLDSWRIDDEWWRKQPVSRLYYRVVLEDGTMTGLFKDLVSGDWYSQRV